MKGSEVKIKKTTYKIIEEGITDHNQKFWKIIKGKTKKTLCEGSNGFDLWGWDAAGRLTCTVHQIVTFQ